MYSEKQIKRAFWAIFHKAGEIWFDCVGTEDECNDSTEDSWYEFVNALRDEMPITQDWIMWAGGACPVPAWQNVTITLRDGTKRCGSASLFNWEHGDESAFDVVAYRVS